jgi:hypothetical protein
MSWGEEKLTSTRDLARNSLSNTLNPTVRTYRPESNYPSFPTLSKKKRMATPYFDRVESLKEAVDKEFVNDRGSSQFDRDAKLWRMTLKFPGNKARRDILRRIFTMFRWGGLMYCVNEKYLNETKQNEGGTDSKGYKFWKETNWPIASAISHGGRVMIQLPQLTDVMTGEEYRDHGFWNWLVC